MAQATKDKKDPKKYKKKTSKKAAKPHCTCCSTARFRNRVAAKGKSSPRNCSDPENSNGHPRKSGWKGLFGRGLLNLARAELRKS